MKLLCTLASNHYQVKFFIFLTMDNSSLCFSIRLEMRTLPKFIYYTYSVDY